MGRIYKKGKMWYIDFQDADGNRHRKSISKSKRIAERKLYEVELKRDKGEHLDILERDDILFDDFVKDYLAYSKANKAPGSYKRDLTSKRALLKYFSGQSLTEIKPQEIERYKAERQKTVTNATINRELAFLSHLYTMAKKWDKIDKDPTKKVQKLKEPPGRTRFLTEDELLRLLNECPDHIVPIIITAVNSGIRKSNLLNLKWNQIDLNNSQIKIISSKNNESRIIPMNNTLVDLFKNLEHRNEEDYVFARKNGRRIKNIIEGFKAALNRAEILDFRFHDLRHTFGSHLAMSGANIKTIQKLMGHKDISMTLRYAHLSQDHLKKAVNELDSRMNLFGTNMAHPQSSNKHRSLKSFINRHAGVVE